ncbi:MAG: glycosyltransferase [Anaerolineales bacterium]|nr:glycosyltransferase [Anaerolineales bacterium]
MKIAYFLARFPKLTETFILREMIALRDLGVEVYIFSLQPPHAEPVHAQVQEMMPYVRYSPLFLSWKLWGAQAYFLFRSPLKYFRALFKVLWQTWREPGVLLAVLSLFPKSVYFARQMQELGIDHIHAHFLWINGIAAQVVSDLIGVTFTVHPHAFGLFMRNQADVRAQLELVNGIVTIAEYHRQYILNLCPRLTAEDVAVVHDGLDPAQFTPAPIPSADGAMRITSVGSLMEKKGHTYLIAACAGLVERGVPFRCVIAGEGPLHASLQAQIERENLQDCVLLLGAKTQAEVYDLYRHSAIFVLPCVVAKGGDRDGMPNVLLEAMCMEIPVVSTPVTGTPELVHDGENGILVPERDAEALTQALMRLIEDEALRVRFGKKGRETVLSGFDIYQSAGQLVAIFQRFCVQNGRRLQ